MKRLLVRTGVLVAAAVTVAVGLYLGATLLGVFSVEYGFHPGADARAWSGHPLQFAQSADCARCHAPESAALASARHAEIGCQSCHGPLFEHDAASKPDKTSVPVGVPTSALCVRCHTTITARPDSLPQITPTKHFTDACLDCHNPHSGVSNRPPTVSHPLSKLPPCIVCHGPDGFRARTARHPTEPTADTVCLSCHAIGRGQIDVKESR
jgi:hypothetical protein